MDVGMDWGRIARFIAGESSEAESAELRAWAAAEPANAELLAALRLAWDAADEREPDWDPASAWGRVRERVRERIGTAPDRGGYPAPARAGNRHPSAWKAASRLRIAAAAAGLLAIGLLGAGALLSRTHAPVAMQELITQKGERAEFRLSDGTRVVVGPESRLRVPVEFGGSIREVRLVGEAFFEVKPDADRPFTVHAGGAVTRVLGTEFNVRAYPGESRVAVVVAEGRVLVRPEDATRGAELGAGDLGELRSGERVVSARKVDVDRHLGWRQGRLAFDRTPLAEVCVDLERWYGIPVRVSDPSLARLRVTASFRDQTLEEVVALIAASLDVAHSQSGRTVVFQPKRTAVRLAL